MDNESKFKRYLSRSLKNALGKLELELVPDLKDKNDFISIKNQFETTTKFLKSGRISQESYDKRCDRMKTALTDLIHRTYSSEFKKLKKNKRSEKVTVLSKRDIIDGRNASVILLRKSNAKFNRLSSEIVKTPELVETMTTKVVSKAKPKKKMVRKKKKK